ncbi:cytochrome P450 [Mycena polygramma]|nr:cytochrome P450 [Mycena polygramma]
MISQILLPIAATVLCYGLVYLARAVYLELTHPLRNVRGPRNPSLTFGNLKELQNDRQQTKRWRDEFGPTFRFKTLFGMNNLYTSDVKALSHIIAKSSNQAFGTAQIRVVTEIFVEKAVQFCHSVGIECPLSLHPSIPRKLREELFTLSTENPTMDELNSLPYLESVVREVLRVHAPVTFLDRLAMEDDVLPLSKPYIDKAGNAHDTLMIPKGQIIHMPILSVNTDPEIWGDDAAEFRPERWEKVPGAASGIPSVWANLFTFFAGPNNCIGFRFSLVEFKALLFTLIRAFEFESAVPAGGIGPTSFGLQAPLVLAEPEKGTSLPLILTAYAL